MNTYVSPTPDITSLRTDSDRLWEALMEMAKLGAELHPRDIHVEDAAAEVEARVQEYALTAGWD